MGGEEEKGGSHSWYILSHVLRCLKVWTDSSLWLDILTVGIGSLQYSDTMFTIFKNPEE